MKIDKYKNIKNLNNSMKLITFLLLSIFLINFVSAELPQEVKPGDCVNIKIPLNASWVNISTITYPNQTMLFLNWPTTLFAGTFYNNSFCNTSQLGTYSYEFFDSTGFHSGNTFTVTPNGDNFDTSQSIIYIILLVLNILALSIFLFFSFTIPYENEKQQDERGRIYVTKVVKLKYVKIFCIWISYGLYLWLVTTLAGLVNNYVSFLPLKEIATKVFIFSTFLGYGVNTFMTWLIFLNIWKDIILNKTIIKEGKAIQGELK